MDKFALQRRVIRVVLKHRPLLDEGMSLVHSMVTERPHGALWAPSLRPAEFWQELERRWVKWLDDLVLRYPPPHPTELFWFEWPSELNPSLTSISGFGELNRAEDTFGMEAGRNWPETEDGSTRLQALLDLPELDECWSRSGWDPARFDSLRDKLEPGFFALSAAVVTLLVLNGLPRSKLLSRLGSTNLSVLSGWAEGDAVPIGTLESGGWTPLSLKRKRTPPTKEELDPSSYMFRLDKYLASGGDPNWQDPTTGETLLMRHRSHGSRVVKALIAAGADPCRSNLHGYSTLQAFGACEISVLKLLVDSGARPKVKSKNGLTSLQLVSFDGRCTRRHLDWYWRQGVRFGKSRKPFQPLHDIGYAGVYERGRERHLQEMAKWWIGRGFHLEEKNAQANTPLARAIEQHAIELDEHLEYIRKNGDLGGSWDYQHDRVAEMLLQLGANPNIRVRSKSRRIPEGGTPLMIQRYDDTRLVKALLNYGADPTLRSTDKKTALEYAMAASNQPARGNEAAGQVAALLKRAMERWNSTAKRKRGVSRSK